MSLPPHEKASAFLSLFSFPNRLFALTLVAIAVNFDGESRPNNSNRVLSQIQIVETDL